MSTAVFDHPDLYQVYVSEGVLSNLPDEGRRQVQASQVLDGWEGEVLQGPGMGGGESVQRTESL